MKAFTYQLLQIPTFLLFILIMAGAAAIAGLATFLFRRYANLKILRSHNEVTGFLFLAIASFYAFLLSFVVFMVWGQLNEIRSNVSKEGSSALGLYRDIKFYPDTLESKPLMIVYLDFIYNVIDEEFPNMEQMKPSTKTAESFDRVFYKIEHLNPKTQFQIQLVAEMFNHLNSLSTYRGLRDASADKDIPLPLWWPMILGAIITLLCAMMLDIEHIRLHIALNALLGIFIAMIFYIILLLDHPYSGSLRIKPESYKQIFTAEQWDAEHQIRPKADDAFERVKKERMLLSDSSFVSDEVIRESMKTAVVKKNEPPDLLTQFRAETAREIRLNDKMIIELEGIPNTRGSLRRKVAGLKKDNNDLRIKMDEYQDGVKANWEVFKASMSHDVKAIAMELNTLKAAAGK